MPLDVAGFVREALAEPGALVVGVRGTAVRGLRGVAQADRRHQAAGGGRGAQRIRPGEAARGVGHAPLRGGSQRGRRVVPLRGGVTGREGDHRAAGGGTGGHHGHARGARRSGDVGGDRLRLRIVDRLQRLGELGAGWGAGVGDRRAGRELDEAQAGAVAAAEAVGEGRIVDVDPHLGAAGSLVGPLDAQQRARAELRGPFGGDDVHLDLAGLLAAEHGSGLEGSGRGLARGVLRGGDGDGQTAHLHLGRGGTAGRGDGQLGAARAGPHGLVQLLDGRLGRGVRRAALGLGLRPLDGFAELLDPGPLGAAGGGFHGMDGRGGQRQAQADDDGTQCPPGHAPIQQSAA